MCGVGNDRDAVDLAVVGAELVKSRINVAQVILILVLGDQLIQWLQLLLRSQLRQQRVVYRDDLIGRGALARKRQVYLLLR